MQKRFRVVKTMVNVPIYYLRINKWLCFILCQCFRVFISDCSSRYGNTCMSKSFEGQYSNEWCSAGARTSNATLVHVHLGGGRRPGRLHVPGRRGPAGSRQWAAEHARRPGRDRWRRRPRRRPDPSSVSSRLTSPPHHWLSHLQHPCFISLWGADLFWSKMSITSWSCLFFYKDLNMLPGGVGFWIF